MSDVKVLDELVRIFGPSGYEKHVQTYFSEIIKPYVSKIHYDNLGNCYADIDGDPSLPKLMINAHCDSIGFIIKYIDDRGFIFTEDIPGCVTVDYRMLPGTFVTILGRNKGKQVKGQFIPTVPIHKMGDDDMLESIVRHEIAIDIGSSSEAQTKAHVEIGDYVVIDSEPRLSSVGKKYISPSIDDRIGLYCMYRIAKNLKKYRSKTRCPITLVSTVAEENFLGAAGVAAYNIKPDIALTLDVTISTDQIVSDADFEVSKMYGGVKLDGGVALSRGLGNDDDLFICLEKMCKGSKKGSTKIPHQIEIGDCGGEHVQIQVAGAGVKTAFVGIPARNVHTGIETISLKDVESTITLCTEFCKKVSKGGFK